MNPLVAAGIIFLVAVMSSTRGWLRFQVAMCLLGGTTALLLPGGALLTVPNFCLPFTVIRAVLGAQPSQAYMRIPAAGFWLAATVLWGLCLSMLVPRFFEGEIMVMTVDRSLSGPVTTLTPFRPVSGNITQSIYAIANVAMFVSIAFLVRKRSSLTLARDAIISLSILICLSAILNLAEFYLPIPSTLSIFRTAYTVYDTYEEGSTGLVRIHGTFPEASVFASFSLCLFAYNLSLWLDNVRPRLTCTLWVMLLGFLLISTSSTAYAGLILYFGFLAADAIYFQFKGKNIPRLPLIFCGALGALIFAGILIIIEHPIVDKIVDLFEVFLIKKLDSHSGHERGALNQAALQALVETGGLGLGFGSVRASSYVVVLLSNVGVIGTAFYLKFLWHVLRPISPSLEYEQHAIGAAASKAVVASLLAAAISATTYELGALFYIIAAMSYRARSELVSNI